MLIGVIILDMLYLIYFLGVIVNIIIYGIKLLKSYRCTNINIVGTIIFILSSWLIYPILFIKNKLS